MKRRFEDSIHAASLPSAKRRCVPGDIYLGYLQPPTAAAAHDSSVGSLSLPVLHKFGFTVLRVLGDGKLCITLLILRRGSRYVLKLFRYTPSTKPPNLRDALSHEYQAYLRFRNAPHGPPSGVPHCHGKLRVHRPLRLSQHTTPAAAVALAALIPKLDALLPLTALVLDYIPRARPLDTLQAVELDTTLARRVVETLAGVHAAGVLHSDIVPRNVLVADGQVWWVDFDCAVTTWTLQIDRGHFTLEGKYAEGMVEDVRRRANGLEEVVDVEEEGCHQRQSLAAAYYKWHIRESTAKAKKEGLRL